MRLERLRCFAPLLLATTLVAAPRHDALARNALQQPFSAYSIWNTPIGANAHYVPAGFDTTVWAGVDVEWWVVTAPGDPRRTIWNDLAGWSTHRCAGTNGPTDSTAFPDPVVVPDVSGGNTPNNCAAILQPDGRTLVQVNALARCAAAGPVYGVPTGVREDLYGLGVTGGHGGSLLSSIGGTLRMGELVSADSIRHALKLVAPCWKYAWPDSGGYRWPAAKSDDCTSHDCTATRYHGSNPAVRMGALVAIPWNTTEATFGLETEVGHKLFRALKSYGAYLVDDSGVGWGAFSLCMERGAREEAQSHFGYTVDTNDTTSPYFRDFLRLLRALNVVDNNAPGSIGGGGSLRAPRAADLVPPADAPMPTTAPFSLTVRGAPTAAGVLELEMSGPGGVPCDLTIFGIDGRRIETLHRGALEGGRLVVRWDASSLAPQVCFARLTSPQGTLVRRIIRLR